MGVWVGWLDLLHIFVNRYACAEQVYYGFNMISGRYVYLQNIHRICLKFRDVEVYTNTKH